MSVDIKELYQEVILDHNKRPRNFRVIDPATHTGKGFNPLCGDQIEVYLSVNAAGIVEAAAFQGEGCAISTASSSIMTELVIGKSIGEIETLFTAFETAVKADETSDELAHLGDLSALVGVREYPARVKCATLPWHALQAAIHHASGAVESEKE